MYKPLGDVPKDLDIHSKEPQPPYDDEGVSYKRYSKTPLGGSSYRLNPQEPYYYNHSAAMSTLFNIHTLPAGKKFYLKKIVFSFRAAASSAYSLGLYESASDQRFFISSDNNYINIDFDVPIKFENQVFAVWGGVTGTDIMSLSVFGWIE